MSDHHHPIDFVPTVHEIAKIEAIRALYMLPTTAAAVRLLIQLGLPANENARFGGPPYEVDLPTAHDVGGSALKLSYYPK